MTYSMNEHILQNHIFDEHPLMIIAAPPGAGKSYLVRRLAVGSVQMKDERIIIVTQINDQALDQIESLCQEFPHQEIYFVHRHNDANFRYLDVLPNLHRKRSFNQLPDEARLVIATADKCITAALDTPPFDIMLVDEAYQMSFAKYNAIVSLANRHVLIGDPGQINPIHTANITRWKGMGVTSEMSTPKALHIQNPQTVYFQLPTSRRLPFDSVQFVQPTFYPNHQFDSLDTGLDRQIRFQDNQQPIWFSSVFNRMTQGESLLWLEYKDKPIFNKDIDLLDQMVLFVRVLLSRKGQVFDHSEWKDIEDRNIGIACPHVIQSNYLQSKLRTEFPNIRIETFEKFQGLERSIMLVCHPLSGESQIDKGHGDSGKMSVALSRHRNNCIVFGRANIGNLVTTRTPSNERYFDSTLNEDEYNWGVQNKLYSLMVHSQRIIHMEGA